MGNRLSKIYTRTGDDGSTGLGDGSRVGKDSLRVDAYGTVDELNSVIGVVLAQPLPAAVADVLLKRAAVGGNFEQALRSPFLWSAIALYLFQIVFFLYAFVAGWKLSAIGVLQTALYALIVLAAGVLLYRETLTPGQLLGTVLAIGGVVLITRS